MVSDVCHFISPAVDTHETFSLLDGKVSEIRMAIYEQEKFKNFSISFFKAAPFDIFHTNPTNK